MLFNIYIKELKDSFRDRRTLILTVLLPIIMMTGLTLFYEKMISDGDGDTYKLAVSSSIDSDLEIILEGYNEIELLKSSNPAKTVKNGEALAALLLEDDFSNNIQEDIESEITIIGDSFSQSSSTLMSLVSKALSDFEKSIVYNRLEVQGIATSIVQPFIVIQEEVSAEDPSINLVAMLIPLILAVAMGVGAGPSAADLFAGEKEKKTMEALLMTPVSRGTLVFAKWLTISTIGVITGIVTLLVVVLEIAFLTENLKKAVPISDQFPIILVFSLLIIIIYSMLIASLLMLTSVIGKTIKEAQSYSSPIMMMAVFPLMITSNIGINEMTAKHFSIPIFNIFTILKELIFGIVNYEHIFIALGSNAIVMIVIFIIGRILFMKDKWVMN